MVFGIIKILGILVFLYLVWRKLNENYKEESLISYAWLVLLAMLVGGRVTFGLVNWGVWNDNLINWFLFWQKPGFDYWGGAGGALLLTGWFCRVNGFRLWSFLEEVIGIFYLLWAFLLMEELSKTGTDLKIIMSVLVAIFGLVISGIIAGKYRSFIWYKSGKKGFVFFFVNMVVSLLMSVVSIYFKERSMAVVYLFISLISMGGLFMLGEVFNNIFVNTKRSNYGNKK